MVNRGKVGIMLAVQVYTFKKLVGKCEYITAWKVWVSCQWRSFELLLLCFKSAAKVWCDSSLSRRLSQQFCYTDVDRNGSSIHIYFFFWVVGLLSNLSLHMWLEGARVWQSQIVPTVAEAESHYALDRFSHTLRLLSTVPVFPLFFPCLSPPCPCQDLPVTSS